MQQQLSKLQVGGANTTEARPLRTEHEELVEWEDYMQDWPDQLIIRRVNGRIRRTEFSQGFVASHAPRAAPSKSARKQAAASSSRHQAATGAGAGAGASSGTRVGAGAGAGVGAGAAAAQVVTSPSDSVVSDVRTPTGMDSLGDEPLWAHDINDLGTLELVNTQ